MTFEELSIAGVYELRQEPVRDERGFFARVYDREEFARHGIELEIAQASVSFSARRGTMRGLHFQLAPHEEAKLVRCVAGAVYDVIVDLRDGSPTLHRWLAVELSSERGNAIAVPKGLAHGFLTLEESCEVEYLISTPYESSAAAGVRWDDPALAIEWPFEPVVVSARDTAFLDL